MDCGDGLLLFIYLFFFFGGGCTFPCFSLISCCFVKSRAAFETYAGHVHFNNRLTLIPIVLIHLAEATESFNLMPPAVEEETLYSHCS